MRFALIFVICFSLLGFARQNLRSTAADDEKKVQPAAAIRAEKRGFPNVNFMDGVDLPAAKNAGGESPRALASADFDADGAADLVTADAGGTLRFYRGNIDSLYPNSPPSKLRQSFGTFTDAPFYAVERSFALNVAPDYLEAGDFNADGRADILAAAQSDNRLQLLAGDGAGNFAGAVSIAVDGQITAFAAGEIGRRNGQADAAVAYVNKDGAFLAIFEHPESAFQHKPEILKLSSPAGDLTIGNLDDDFYADVAAASGNLLTVIHGRGQVYPWDLDERFGIERPKAVVAQRQMPFQIAALAAGNFDARRGAELAILSADGGVYYLEPAQIGEKPSERRLQGSEKSRAKKIGFVPSGGQSRNPAVLQNPSLDAGTAEKNGLVLAMRDDLGGEGLREFLKKRQDAEIEKFKSADKSQIENSLAKGAALASRQKEQAKKAFLDSIAGKPSSTLARWRLEPLVLDATLTGAAASNLPRKMFRARVSAGQADDLILLDAVSNQIKIVSQIKTGDQKPQTEIVSFDAETAPVAVLPLRLNPDALHDLVVLREGAGAAAIVLSQPALTLTVNTTADDPGGSCLQPGQPCTLRNAIESANGGGGADLINFDIPGGGTISPLSELPVIRQPVTIIGTVNAGSGQPLIEISGALAPAGTDGLKLRTSSSLIYGLAVSEFRGVVTGESVVGGNGITIESTILSPDNGNNTIVGCYLGTDKTGTLDKGNVVGLNIFDSDNNFIGGSLPQSRNVISGNGQRSFPGAGVSMIAGNSNIFEGNIIGLNAPGTGKLGNSQGLFFTGADNTFGGDAAGAGNTVSGNGEQRPPDDPEPGCDGYGIVIPVLFNPETGEILTTNNTLKGNRVGTNPAGTTGLGNCSTGIATTPLTQTVVGSITENGRNTISDNGYQAIFCQSFTVFPNPPTEGGFCAISGNNIGTDIAGQIAIPNDERNLRSGLQPITGVIDIGGNLSFSNVGAPGGTSPGQACTGFCNLISGNAGTGIVRWGYGVFGVFNNFVGTNKTGTLRVTHPTDGNGGIGTNGVGLNYIGLVANGQNGEINMGNLISGNGSYGLFVNSFLSEFSETRVEANLIGTNAAGDGAIPNSHAPDNDIFGSGMANFTRLGDRVYIGGTNPNSRNIVSGNEAAGMQVRDFGGQTLVVNNLIGLSRSLQPLGNGRSGIDLVGYFTQIGGTSPQEANQIANNGTDGSGFPGVAVWSGFGHTIRGNIIRNNGGLGIDLGNYSVFTGGDGVTPNDECTLDADGGPNLLQNFPVLTAPVFNSDGTATVSGTIKTTPRETLTIDFYANQANDPTNHGEGEIYLGAIEVETDGNGFGAFNFTSAGPVAGGAKISATATDFFGNTSEFSCNAGETCADSPLSGKFEKLGDLIAAGGEVCPIAIIVNINTDEPDQNINDGVCDVDTSNTGLQCSLRAAIQTAENLPGTDRIFFNIPGGGVQTISPSSVLPEITQPVILDATTQPGFTNRPLIELNGATLAGQGAVGLRARSSNSVISGFFINRFQTGIALLGSGSSNRINTCYFGTDANFPLPTQPNMSYGIQVITSTNNIIGGVSNPAASNFFIGNYVGVYVADEQNRFVGNSFIGNFIGMSVQTGKNNQIGANVGEAYNIFLTNSFGGIWLGDNDPPTPLNLREHLAKTGRSPVEIERELELLRPRLEQFKNFAPPETTGRKSNPSTVAFTTGNKIIGNYIGTNQSNVSDLGNGRGILVDAAEDNFIGGENAADRNYISANLFEGIVLSPMAKKNYILRNYIGTTNDGNAALGNRNGVVVMGNENVISANLISANRENGIWLLPEDASPVQPQRNKIWGNRIGVNVDGSAALANALNGIFVQGNNNEIGGISASDGNLISGNTQHGVLISPASQENVVQHNMIGTNLNGDAGVGNGGSGVVIAGTNNRVGGPTANSRNVISGNFRGISIAKAESVLTDHANNNIVQGNYVGTSADGASAIPNTSAGIIIFNGASNNQIGGITNGTGNVVSGNGGIGIALISGDSFGESPLMNQIKNNIVGLNAALSSAVPNAATGISIFKSANNIVGGPESLAPNIVGGNGEVGILVKGLGANGNTIERNFVGVTPDGNQFGNVSHGIAVSESALNTIVRGNTVGANQANGILIQAVGGAGGLNRQTDGGSPFSVEITSNLVGVYQDGSGHIQPAPNLMNGVSLECVQQALIGQMQTAQTLKNIISANSAAGIKIINFIELRTGARAGFCGQFSRQNIINSSVIGSDENGSDGLGNSVGIQLSDATETTLGSLQNSQRNVLKLNLQTGILIEGDSAERNRIINNLIESNGSHGVLMTGGAKLNEVGGTAENSGNTISGNGGAGVRLDESAGHCNLIDPNSIFGNAGLGIDIGGAGRTPNDPADADEGANRGQNYPEIVSKQIVNNELIIRFKIDSSPANSNYGSAGLYVEFFKADASGEGERFIGSTFYTVADYQNSPAPGVKTVNLGDLSTILIDPNDPITATATDADNNTSEFFPTFAPTASNVSVSGRVRETTGQGVRSAIVTITDGDLTQTARTNDFGVYRFENVPSGRTYILTVAHGRYTFSPDSRVLNVLDDVADADFVAIE